LLFARAFEPGQDETLSLDLGLLFDTSESMLKELRLSQEAAVRFLDAIPRARELYTIFFAGDIHISRYDSESQQGLTERILDAKGGGYTALYDAIATYLARVQDSPGRKVLVLFTDGEDSDSRLTMTEVLGLVRSSAVTVYPIAFSGGFTAGSSRGIKPQAFLSQLAEMTGGQVFKPSTSKELPVIYEKILDELKAQYVLGYASDRPEDGGKFRKLKVEVRGKGLKVRHRAGYYPPPLTPSSN
ncbi:MAG TPA: VWA domain-containing protein, partial [Vicinamibacteria bacterium]|nr:VWA domain-containing protein [Vicinamibacteria bacterium]